jgi:ribosomal protein L13E
MTRFGNLPIPLFTGDTKMIIKSTVHKFKKADDYAAFWRVPVPLVKSICICRALRLHPYLENHGEAFAKRHRRNAALSFFAQRLVGLAYDRRRVASVNDFDSTVNDYWLRQQSEAFALELMEEGA